MKLPAPEEIGNDTNSVFLLCFVQREILRGLTAGNVMSGWQHVLECDRVGVGLCAGGRQRALLGPGIMAVTKGSFGTWE